MYIPPGARTILPPAQHLTHYFFFFILSHYYISISSTTYHSTPIINVIFFFTSSRIHVCGCSPAEPHHARPTRSPRQSYTLITPAAATTLLRVFRRARRVRGLAEDSCMLPLLLLDPRTTIYTPAFVIIQH